MRDKSFILGILFLCFITTLSAQENPKEDIEACTLDNLGSFLPTHKKRQHVLTTFEKIVEKTQCFDQNGKIILPSVKLSDEEVVNISKTYDKKYVETFGKKQFDEHSKVIEGQKVSYRDLAVSGLIDLFEDYRAAEIQKISSNAQSLVKIVKEKIIKSGNEYYGEICKRLDAVRLATLRPFEEKEITLFADEGKAQKANLSEDEFLLIKNKFYKSLEKKERLDLLDSQSVAIFGCELVKNVDENTGNVVKCISPILQASYLQSKVMSKKKFLNRLEERKVAVNKESVMPKDSQRVCEILEKNKCSQLLNSKRVWVNNYKQILGQKEEKGEQVKFKSPDDQIIYGSISGYVFDKLTGEKIESANISISNTNLTATSSKDGEYKFGGIEFANKGRNLKAMRKFYQDETIVLKSILPDTEVKGYDFYLTPKPVDIEGSVFRSDSKTPIQSVEIELVFSYEKKDGKIFDLKKTATTDAQGNYLIKAVPAIYNRVSIAAKDNSFVPRPKEKISINPEVEKDKLDFELVPKFTKISGRVLDEKTGDVLSNIKVELVNKNDPTGRPYIVETNDDGSYSLDIKYNPLNWDPDLTLQARESERELYHPSVRKEKISPISDFKHLSPQKNHTLVGGSAVLKYENNTQKDIKLTPLYADVSGRVIDARSGQGVHGAILKMFYRGKMRTTTAGNNGHYQFRHVPPGNYSIEVEAKGYFANKASIVMKNDDIKKDIFLVLEEYGKNRIIIALTWQQQPRDLDSQLFNQKYLLNYKSIDSGYNRLDRISENESGPRAMLDLDDVNGFGPETTIIQLDKDNRPLVSEPYKFLVYHYSGDKNIATSNAVVTVIKNGKTIHEVKADDLRLKSESRLWHVLDVVDGNVVVKNELRFKVEYDFINAREKEREQIKDRNEKLKTEMAKVESLPGKLAVVEEKIKSAYGRAYEITGDNTLGRYAFGATFRKPADFKGEAHDLFLEAVMLETNIKNYSLAQKTQMENRIKNLQTQIDANLASEVEMTPQRSAQIEQLRFQQTQIKTSLANYDPQIMEALRKDALAKKERIEQEAKQLVETVKQLELEKTKIEKEIALIGMRPSEKVQRIQVELEKNQNKINEINKKIEEMFVKIKEELKKFY